MCITIFPHLVSHKSAIEQLTDDELRTFKLFREKTERLYRAMKGTKIPIAKYTIERSSKKVVAFESRNPRFDEIELLAIKFRFFFAEKEPTYVFKVLNILSRCATDPWAKNYISRIRLWHREFLDQTDTSGKFGHPVSNEKIINLWFNSEIFHQDEEKSTQLNYVNEKIGVEASIYQLNIALRLCTTNVIAIYNTIHKTSKEHPFIYTPSHHFERRT
ncbi:MAG: hypothetical protein AB1479_00380 [Pseudomonadota bacterium]